MDGTLKRMVDKLKRHPQHKSKPQNTLEKLALELTNPIDIRRKFNHLLQVGNEMALEMADDDDDDDDLLHTMEVRAQHQRVKHDTARAGHLPIQLCLQKLQLPTPPGAYTFTSWLKFEYGPLHAAVIVGDITIEWGRESIVEPRYNPIHEAEFKANVGDQSEWLQSQGRFQLEMSLADTQRNSEKKLEILSEYMTAKSQMIGSLVDVIVDYNINKSYHVLNCNCQHFARDVMAALGIMKPVKFRGNLQERFNQLRTGNVKVPAELHTHENLDVYIAANIQELEKQEMEYLQCLYFKAHLPAIEKADDPIAWMCDIPTCKSAELDKLIGEHALPFNQFLDESKQVRDQPSSTSGRLSESQPASHQSPSQSQKFNVFTYHASSAVEQNEHFEVVDVQRPKCINDCGMYGDPELAGLCSQCFNKEQQALKEKEMADRDKQLYQLSTVEIPVTHETLIPSIQQTNTNLLSNDLVSVNPECRTKCRTDGCEFFGTSQTCFHCSRCFEANAEKILKEFENSMPSYTHMPSTVPVQQQTLSTYSTEPQTNHYESKKCHNCKEFYANEEYHGLCHGCFMEKTKLDTAVNTREVYNETSDHRPTDHVVQPVHSRYQDSRQKPYSPRYEKCMNLDCQGPRTENGYCDICNMEVKSTSQQQQAVPNEMLPQRKQCGHYPQQQDMLESPRLIANLSLSTQSTPTYTRPFTQANSTMNSTCTEQCYLCYHTQVRAKNFVCQYHAEQMKEILLHNTHRQAPRQSMPSTTLAKKTITRGGTHSTLTQPQFDSVHLISQARLPNPYHVNTTNTAGVPTNTPSSSHAIVRRQLCATPGCSFKGYEEIDNLCPDCYELVNPGRKAPDHLPLV